MTDPPSPLVVDDTVGKRFRVHRSSMTSPEVLEQERDRIFDKCWLYLGHSSEIPEPGDYVRRDVAGRSIMFVRGKKDGQVRAFHNTCPHRGAIVCRQDKGNAKAFQCFYHAWTFDTEGALKGIPDKGGYEGTGFDKAERGLKQVARLEEYRGFWFLSYWAENVSLREYLADAALAIDIVVDQSLDGDLKIVDGTHRYHTRANWKLLAENSVDGYHGAPTHQTYIDYIVKAGGMRMNEDGKTPGAGRSYSLGNGHSVIEYWAPWGRPVARWVPLMGEEAKEEIEGVREQLEERYGPDRAERITEYNRNILIYPNLVINDIMAVTVRTFYPSAPDQLDINAWALAPADEVGTRLHTRLKNFLEFLGPGGFATPDDVEALESCQKGFESGGEHWNDISRGMGHEPMDHDELQMRTFWRQWQAQIDGVRRDEWSDDPGASRFPSADVFVR